MMVVGKMCFAQEGKRPLLIGNAVPDIEFSMLNFSKQRIKLSNFKGKIVLLDFWGTWCSSCISSFPHLDSLQNKFKNEIQILLVNSIEGSGDTKEKIADFLVKQKRNGNYFNLPIAYDDREARSLFPHGFVPHYVWIGRDGKLIGITSSEFITEENVKKILLNK